MLKATDPAAPCPFVLQTQQSLLSEDTFLEAKRFHYGKHFPQNASSGSLLQSYQVTYICNQCFIHGQWLALKKV